MAFTASLAGLFLIVGRLRARLVRSESELSDAREAVLEATRRRDEFLSTMSHEVRTPLNAVLGMVDLLSTTDLNEKQQGYADGILRGGEEMLRLAEHFFENAQETIVSAPKPVTHETPVHGDRRRISDCLVLVVEDNPVNQIVALHHLEKLGCHWDLAKNGVEAVKAIQQRTYDLILMDCQMPEMDGYAATVQIRKFEEGGPHTPIVAVTAFVLAGDREKCLAAGMDDYLGKPFRASELKSILGRWLGKFSPVDMYVLRDVTGNDTEGMRHLSEIYLEHSKESLNKLQHALRADDAGSVQRIAHGCAGSSASFGAKPLAAMLKELEEMGKASQLTGASMKLEDCRKEFARVASYLERLP